MSETQPDDKPLPISEAIAIGQARDIITRRVVDAVSRGADMREAAAEAAREIRRLWMPATQLNRTTE